MIHLKTVDLRARERATVVIMRETKAKRACVCCIALFNVHKRKFSISCHLFGPGTLVRAVKPVYEGKRIDMVINSFLYVFTFFLRISFKLLLFTLADI